MQKYAQRYFISRSNKVPRCFYCTFCLLGSPFGGFWASAMKRACNIKDFNNLIPGHGGFMDRLDCQFIMVSFVYLYHATFLGHPTMPTISSVDQMHQMASLRLSKTEKSLWKPM